MNNYETLSEVITALKQRVYNYDFNLRPAYIECPSLKLKLHPKDFEVDVNYRFEGISSTDDNSVLYAIFSKKWVKGAWVDACGVYAENIADAMRGKLNRQLEHRGKLLSSAKNIEEIRDGFDELSSEIIMLVKMIQPNTQTLYVDFCPMANNNKGAKWLSAEKEIRNPYLKGSMLDCGNITDSIN